MSSDLVQCIVTRADRNGAVMAPIDRGSDFALHVYGILTSDLGGLKVRRGHPVCARLEKPLGSGGKGKALDVIIDDKTTFKAEVNKANAKRPKGSVYAISTGKHLVTIKYNNEIIYSKQIFVSAQETKQIILP